MAGFQSREELAKAQFQELFGDSVRPSSTLEQILGLGPRRKTKERFQGSLAKAEDLVPRLVRRPDQLRPQKR